MNTDNNNSTMSDKELKEWSKGTKEYNFLADDIKKYHLKTITDEELKEWNKGLEEQHSSKVMSDEELKEWSKDTK
jgi:hypothetical protein